jgi:hypothetical protein
MASKKIFQGLPQWAQGVIGIAIVGGIGFIGYKIYSAMQKAKALESATEENQATSEEAKNLIKKGVKATLNKAQLISAVNGLKQAFSDYDAITRPHYTEFLREIVKVKNDLDMLNLLKAYGNQDIKFPFTKFTVSDFSGNLTQTTKNFLNNQELAASNNLLARKGIKYRF